MEIHVRNTCKWTHQWKHITSISFESRNNKGTLQAVSQRILNCILAVCYAYGGMRTKMH